MTEYSKNSLFEFPLTFSIRVVGANTEAFQELVLDILAHHVPLDDHHSVSQRLSGGGKYRSLTVTFLAQSRRQLDDLYRELGERQEVLMLL